MIKGLGIDLVEVARVERSLSRQTGLAERLFCPDEILYCRDKRYPAVHFAARFAAKEAFLKALGTGLRGKMSWLDLEVTLDELGRPFLKVGGECRAVMERIGAKAIQLSLTHQAQMAVAVVLLEG